MPENPRIELILERWEDLRQQGVEVSVEELCREHPDLLDVIRQRIEALRAMEWLDSSGIDGGEEDNLEPVPKTLGRYRLDSLIGAGGFGQVWKGFDPELQRTVAIKIPRSGRLGSPQQSARFLDEARKVAQLRHPGIVPVHDVGSDGDYCYIVSEFIDGGNLAEHQEKLLWQDAVRLIVKIAGILQHAHDNGFVHRDIKPANILLDSAESPYLTDFGIAVTGEELREGKTGTAGTLAYMSPEQVGGRQIDARTDIYSLSVVLFELLAGQRPFVASDPVDLRRIILANDPKFPESVEIPPHLKRICLKALAKEPQDRYPSAGEFADALLAVVKPTRRSGAWVIGIAAVLVLVAVAYGGLLWSQQGNGKAETSLLDPKQHAEKLAASEQRVREQVEKVKEVGKSVDAAIEDMMGPAAGGTVALSGKSVSDADFQQWRGNPFLRKLVLADTQTTDSHLAYLAGCPLLESLDLSGTKITDAGLEYLADNGGMLVELNLGETAITDKAIKYFQKMPRLEKLRLTGTKVTDQGVDELRRLLPKCKIER